MGDCAIHLAARKGDNDLVKLFIEAGTKVDTQNSEGQTCLHIACSKGDENIIRTLYLARANPSVMDKEDRTPMHLAAEKGHTSTVEFLADKFRASVFDRTKDGSTLMHIAALNGHPETAMVKLSPDLPHSHCLPYRFSSRKVSPSSCPTRAGPGGSTPRPPRVTWPSSTL